MEQRYTAAQVSKALFEMDPVNTCCKENECPDEYDRVAQTIVDELILNPTQSLHFAMVQSIRESFFDGEPYNTSILQPVTQLLEQENQKN